ncbi:hypothetical protein A0J48_025125 [Sphaerospermopsis aphanizomenoides BCCUSP55]|nr:hypothetical protein [Sphaerospermopsis aphanizomenoides BCCUSP55]
MSSNISPIRKSILVILLIIAAVTASTEITRSLVNFNMKQCPINKVVDVTELQPYQVRLQFLGNPSSLFFKLLAPSNLTSINQDIDKFKTYEYKPSSCYYRYMEQNK